MKVFVLLVCLALCLIAAGCSGQTEDSGTKADPEGSESEVTSGSAGDYTLNTKVTDVMNDPVFGDYGRLIFPVGEVAYPAPGAVIMQYTGLSEVTGNEPPTYACVGTRDGIAAYRSMENYISRIQADGTDARIEVFDGLGHGFGLGEGTVAEGWINNAVDFWEQNME